jgi:DNA-binding FadR family transcriptional regulator
LNSIWGIVRERGLRVGDQLPSIREFADQLQVKPTAVRDALLQAQSQGFVKVLPRAGAFLQATAPVARANIESPEQALTSGLKGVLNHDGHNLFHLLDARRVIEMELVGRAASCRRLEDLLPVRRALDAMLQLPADVPRAEHVNCDIRFHLEIARLGANQALLAVEQTLLELLRSHLVEVPSQLQRRHLADRSHISIYEALVAGDATKARSEMYEHLSLAYDGLLRDIQQLPAMEEQAVVRGECDQAIEFALRTESL